MFRLICIAIVLVLFLLLFIPVVLIELVIGLFNRKARDYSCLRMVQGLLKTFRFIAGTKLTVIGEENIPTDQAVLFVGNHRSYFDIILTYPRYKNPTGYVAKDSLKKVPLFNVWMMLLNCLFLDRKDIRKGLKTINKGTEQLKSGISVCIFPEGTRGEREGALLPFKEGSLKMAQKAKCPIIPMALSNTAEIWENHFPRIKRANVILEYGKPINIQELSKEDQKFLGAYTQRAIQDILDKNTPLVG